MLITRCQLVSLLILLPAHNLCYLIVYSLGLYCFHPKDQKEFHCKVKDKKLTLLFDVRILNLFIEIMLKEHVV